MAQFLWLDQGHQFETCALLGRKERYRNKRFEEVEDLLETTLAEAVTVLRNFSHYDGLSRLN